jgi:hypothetical protein
MEDSSGMRRVRIPQSGRNKKPPGYAAVGFALGGLWVAAHYSCDKRVLGRLLQVAEKLDIQRPAHKAAMDCDGCGIAEAIV